MPDIKSAAPPKVTPRFYDHIRALLRAGKNDQAIARACAIAVIVPDDLLAKELLFNGFFQKRDWLPALAVANELVQRQPGVARLESFLITTLANLKRYDEAIAHAFEYITRYGEDVAMLDALKVAHFAVIGKLVDGGRGAGERPRNEFSSAAFWRQQKNCSRSFSSTGRKTARASLVVSK
jgi:hypothetical protein